MNPPLVRSSCFRDKVLFFIGNLELNENRPLFKTLDDNLVIVKGRKLREVAKNKEGMHVISVIDIPRECMQEGTSMCNCNGWMGI